MRDLERMVGVALFTRTSKGAAVTAAGAALAEASRHIVELTAALPAEAQRATRGSTRQCVVATIPTPIVARVVAHVSRSAAAEMPEAHVSLAESPTPEQPEALVAGHIDVGVCHAFTTVSPFLHQLRRERLLDDAACCALLAPDHALAAQPEIALAQLADIPFLFMPRSLSPAFYDRVMTFFAAQNFLPRVEQPYDGLQTTWSLELIRRAATAEVATWGAETRVSGRGSSLRTPAAARTRPVGRRTGRYRT